MKAQATAMLGVAFLLLVVTIWSGEGVTVGGWEPIRDLRDPYVREIAEYAVSAYDKRCGKRLKLWSIVKGEKQVVSGANYRLVLALKDGDGAGRPTRNYQAIVWDKPWLKFRNLTSFEPFNP